MTNDDRHHTPRLPWYRPRNIALAILLMIVGLVGFVAVRALTATPGNAVDYASRLNELARANQPGDRDAPNRWQEYIELLSDYKEIEKRCDTTASASVGEPLNFEYAHDTSSVDEAAAPLVRADAIACLDAIRASDIYDRLDAFIEPAIVYQEAAPRSFLILSIYPNFSSSRALCRACVAEFRIALADGRHDDAIRAIRHALALARIASHQPILIGYLVGLAETALTLQTIRDEAINGNIDAPTARTLLTTLNPMPIPALSLGMGGEELGMLDLIQRTHSDDGKGNGMLLLSEFRKLDLGMGTPTGAGTHPIVNAAGFIFPDKATTTAKAQDFYKQLTSQAAMTPYQRRNAPNLDQQIEIGLSRFDILLRIALPALGRIVNSSDAVALDADLARLLLALTIYHAEQGVYPDSLEDLAPGILPEIPSDGFAPDGKFRYLKRAPTADDPREFILYSVGADFTDNNGRFIDNREALTHRGKGADYVVNPPTTPSQPE